MKIIFKLMFFVTVFFIGAHSAFAACGDSITNGTGTAIDPYQISTPAELAAVGNCLGAGNSGKYFKIMNDIDLNVSPYNTGDGWQPIGSAEVGFYGHVDGDNKVISNLYINRPSTSYVGLFGYVASGAVIENLFLTEVTIDGGTTDIAALVGHLEGTLRSVGVSNGTITGLMRMGGVVGSNYGSGVVERAYSTGLTITQKAAGSECCIGSITGATEFGGTISDAYARSNIVHTSGGQGVLGGAIGSNYLGGSLTRLYSTGTVTTLSSYPVQVGGLVGNLGTPATDSYWDTETSGWATSDFGTGKTTTQMKDQSTYVGWDFDDIWAINPLINDGYPYLLPQAPVDVTAPTVNTFSPADNATGINLNPNYVITFSEVVEKHSGLFSIYKSADDSLVESIDMISPNVSGTGTNQITVYPSVNLTANTAYYIRIGSTAFRDPTGNNYAGISNSTTWNFTTGNYTAPVLTTVAPIDSITTIANAQYHFRTSKICDILAEAPQSSLGGESLETIITAPVPSTDLTATIAGIQVGGTYSVRFQCTDADLNNSNIISVGPFTVVAPVVPDVPMSSGSIASVQRIEANLGNIPKQPINQFKFSRSLRINAKGEDVKELQKFLNTSGFILADKGPGSLGNETILFGPKLRSALIKFQKTNKLKPDGIFGPKTIAFVNSIMN